MFWSSQYTSFYELKKEVLGTIIFLIKDMGSSTETQELKFQVRV